MILTVFPVEIFFLTWYNKIVGVISTLLLLAACLIVTKNKSRDNNLTFIIDKKKLLILFLTALVWCWIGGIGGFFYQYLDHDWRNAIFHDLINYDWPVIYSRTNRMLDYFIGVWIVPALFGKLLTALGCADSVSWTCANVVLLLYCAICVTVVFCLILKLTKSKTGNAIFFTLLVFILFSGMDFLGFFAIGINPLKVTIYEGWSGGIFQLQSMSTGLFWSYNQHPFAWLLFLAMLVDRDIKNLAFWGLLAMPFAPLPLVGMVLFAFVTAFQVRKIQRLSVKKFLIEIFSLQNIFAVLSIGVTYLLYYSANSISKSTKSDSSLFMLSGTGAQGIRLYIIFLLLEVIPFFVFTLKSNKKNPLYWLSLFILTVFPLIRVGESMDFGMKATIPAIVYMYLLTVNELKILRKEFKLGNLRAKVVTPLLVAVLCIGSLTALIEPARGLYLIFEEKNLFLSCDNLKTLDNEMIDSDNFTSDYEESLYYKYISDTDIY